MSVSAAESAELARLREENTLLKKELAELRRAGAPRTVVGLTDVLMVIGGAGEVAYANATAEKFFGMGRAQLLGQPLKSLKSSRVDGAILVQAVQDAVETGKTCVTEVVLAADSPAQTQWYEIAASPTSSGTQLMISDRSETRRMAATLSRYLSPQVLDAVMRSGVDPYQARKYELTVLFADLRGFTSLSSQLPAEQVKKLIDEYLTVQIDIILQEGATLDKIVGDEVMALFGAPLPAEHHAAWAVNAALKMQEGHNRLMALWSRRGLNPCPIGIGINSGDMVVGPVGSKQQMNYTVLGHNVNLAARLCSHAEGGEILLAPRTFELARDAFSKEVATPWRPMKFVRGRAIQAKGIAEPVQTVIVRLERDADL